MKNFVSKIIILSAFIALFISCSSSDSPAPTPVDTKPTISALGASSGKYGSTLTITGTNFSTTVANNKVTINGVEATVTAATATQLAVTVPACGGNGTVNVKVGGTTATGPNFTYIPDVFAVGSIKANGKATPMLWKNGVATALTPEYNFANANAITVIDNDVYIVGTVAYALPYPFFWKNGVVDVILDFGEFNDVFVSGNDVYKAGNVGSGLIFSGTTNLVGTSPDISNVTSMFISGNDIYAVGSSYIDSKNKNGVYYKNGKITLINSGPHDCTLNKIAVSNAGDVYIVGTERYGTVDKLCLWKNGLPNILGENALNTDKNSLFIDKNDIYVVGRDGGKARYWKNGIGTDLSASTDCYANAIFKFGDDIYIGGTQGTATNSIAKIWKNGVATNLTDGASYATINAIFVR
ncbi:IPT/TIG domain-containing protein [Flavobacterium sp.]|uniref:IPT/TIG domain-containing protein n=1 Tax=Flavobacterium sp. TaxID=239 RepID=UPI0026112C1B|nr:IPT/TIG domain-containing protein [Flavobacterium sp.]